MERNGRDREQLKVIHGLLVQGAKCANSISQRQLGVHVRERPSYWYLWHGTRATKADCVRSMSDTRWAYEGEVERWTEEEVERELVEMTGWLEQLAGLEAKEEEEGESGSSVRGSENCLYED